MSSSKTLNNLNIRKFPSKASFKNATNIGEDDLCVVAGSGEPLMQFETMPTPAAEWEGQVVMFVGTSTSEFTQGYLYRCMGNGDDTYFWTLSETQPAPATYATATQTTINVTERTLKIRVGPNFRADDFSYQPYPYRSFVHIHDSNGNEFVGSVTYINNDACEQHIYKATGIFEGKRFFVVGNTATSQNFYIAISDGTNNPISSSSLTLQVEYQYYGNLGGGVFDVFANSTQSEIFVSIPLTKVNTTATLAVADWSSNTQTVTVSGVKADSVVFVSPAPASAGDYVSAGILCTAQAADSLTFTCTTTPSNAITVNVVCM